MAQASFPERAERVLIAGMVLGIALVMERFVLDVRIFQTGLAILVVCTFLQIAVGNLPKTGGLTSSLVRIVAILAIVAIVFGIGILLVPTLSRLGR